MGAVLPASSEEQAIAMANDTIYGLNSSVLTNDANAPMQSGANGALAPPTTMAARMILASHSAGSSHRGWAVKAASKGRISIWKPRL